MNGRIDFTNYVVPAAGYTQGFVVNRTLVAGAPETIDFRTEGLDGIPFRPYGVIAQNKGTAPLTIRINEIGYSITVSTGQNLQLPYPGPLEQSATLEGEGPVTVIFVNYPVFPVGV